MCHSTKRGYFLRLSGILLLAMTGCTISITPWTKQPAPPAPTPDGGPWSPAAMAKNGGPPPSQGQNNENTTLMIKKLTEEEDLRRALEGQVSALKKQLKERDDNLRLASFEIDASSKQIKQTRDEFHQWQGEMDEMRERIRKLESYRSTAKPLIDDIYRFLDRDKEIPRTKMPSIIDR